MKYKPLRRPCSRCNKLFIPGGRCSKVCNECNQNLNGTRREWGSARDYNTEEYDSPEKVKYQNRYKKGRGIK